MKKIGILFVASTLALSISACGKRTVAEDEEIIVSGYDGDGNALDGSVPEIGAAIGVNYNVRMSSVPASLATVSFGGTGSETDGIASVSAIVTDDNNLPVEGLAVQFSSSGGRLLAPSAFTDENGIASVLLSIDFDPANQDIIVTIEGVEDDQLVGEARIVTTGTTLEATGEDNVVAGNDVEVTATLTAGSGEPLANHEVTIFSEALNTLSQASAMTDPFGQVQVTVDTTNGDDTISFYALPDQDGVASASASYEFSVSDDQLQFAADAPLELAVNQVHSIDLSWNLNGAPVAGEDIKFNITSGNIAGSPVATTDANGNATVMVSSPVAGEVVLYAEAIDGSVVNKHTFDFIGVTPSQLIAKTSSSRVTTRDRATVSVEVQDADGNTVRDTPVVFTSLDLRGGQISATSATTDANGVAEITFTAGGNATEADGIEIMATVEGTQITNSVYLTVAEQALNVTIGTANTIEEINNGTQYSVPYVVQVADGSGQALEGAEVYLSLFTTSYAKGYLVHIDRNFNTISEIGEDEDFAPVRWSVAAGTTVVCGNEDLNGNRIMDTGEDLNGNGSLDPQDPALLMADQTGLTTIESDGVLTTDATGFGYFNLVYPASASGWASVNVIARAQALGVESDTSYETSLLTSAEKMNQVNDAQPNQTSPFGMDNLCTTTN